MNNINETNRDIGSSPFIGGIAPIPAKREVVRRLPVIVKQSRFANYAPDVSFDTSRASVVIPKRLGLLRN
jgi:hypothetical protein